MATANVGICSVCTEDYNSRHCQSVSLPCGHDFCLSCLVRLRASGKHKCPTCRSNWARVNLQTQFGMEALAAALQADQEEDEEDAGKKKVEADRCEKHSMPYDFWVQKKRKFYCRKCASEEKSHVKLELIEDAIPQVKVALAADVPQVKKKVENYLESLDKMHANLIRKRNSAREFAKAVLTLDDKFSQEIEQAAASRATALNASVQIEKVEKKISSIKSPADLNVVMECKSILEKVGICPRVPASDLPQTLLSNIASSYMQEEVAAVSPLSRAAFVTAILWGGVAGPLIEVAPEVTDETRFECYEKPIPRFRDFDDCGRKESRRSKSSDIQLKWQYQRFDGSWNTYDSSQNSMGSLSTASDSIEKHYLKTSGHGTVMILREGALFMLDFQMMIELNTEKGTNVNIRRAPL